MTHIPGMGLKTSRRKFLTAAGATAGTLLTVGISHRGYAEERAPTPECSHQDEPTPRQTAGPYFKPNSPQRSLLIEPGETARTLRVFGRVMTTSCKPIAKTLLDFWHADAGGLYDLKGFRHRGHLFSDAEGTFELRTILPGLYAGRARHIHVRVQPAGGTILTTQLYFPNEPANDADSLFNPVLLLKLTPNVSPLEAGFDFVLKT
jgi:protocatechuate 3,4-dioxygenase beta subunit